VIEEFLAGVETSTLDRETGAACLTRPRYHSPRRRRRRRGNAWRQRMSGALRHLRERVRHRSRTGDKALRRPAQPSDVGQPPTQPGQ
jgi:hypothetical protein